MNYFYIIKHGKTGKFYHRTHASHRWYKKPTVFYDLEQLRKELNHLMEFRRNSIFDLFEHGRVIQYECVPIDKKPAINYCMHLPIVQLFLTQFKRYSNFELSVEIKKDDISIIRERNFDENTNRLVYIIRAIARYVLRQKGGSE